MIPSPIRLNNYNKENEKCKKEHPKTNEIAEEQYDFMNGNAIRNAVSAILKKKH